MIVSRDTITHGALWRINGCAIEACTLRTESSAGEPKKAVFSYLTLEAYINW